MASLNEAMAFKVRAVMRAWTEAMIAEGKVPVCVVAGDALDDAGGPSLYHTDNINPRRDLAPALTYLAAQLTQGKFTVQREMNSPYFSPSEN